MRNFLFRAGDAEIRAGKWAAVINTFATHADGTVSHHASKITSAGVFNTEQEAVQGADRALQHLEATGEFPNMTEPF